MRVAITAVVLASIFTSCGGNGSSSTSPPPGGTVVFTPVYEIQGNGQTSPLEGSTVSIAAIVTGDFQDNDDNSSNDLGGFYVQEATPDSDSSSSDGIFVFDGENPAVDVSVGDRVIVEGSVTEYFGETQIAATRVEVSGSGSIQPININLPAKDLVTNSDGLLIADLERFEGMFIRFPQELTANNLFNLERFGEVQLSQGGRLYQFANQSSPDVSGYEAHKRTVASRSILLDDGRRASNATPIRYLTSGNAPDYSIRSGDAVTGVSGNLRYSKGSGGSGLETYRLMPAGTPEFESLNPRPGPPAIGGSLRIASLNVLNFFSTIDAGQDACGPARDDGCRGADNAEEFSRQLNKTITTLSQIDADIIGLIELENNATESLQPIVAGLNAKVGAGTYAYLNTGTIGNDVIKTGFLYKPDTVSLKGSYSLLDAGVDARFNSSKNREALAQTFVQISSGGALTIVVNHLKSKGSDCVDEGDPNLGDGQGNCNKTRTDAAAAIVDWLATDPTGSDDPDFLIVGDLNAYLAEDPLTALKNAEFVNLIEAANDSDVYSFVFDGQSGALDHALASASLVQQVVETTEWHINADEPPALDYNLEFGRDPDLFDARSPYRVSDHDPIIIGIELSD